MARLSRKFNMESPLCEYDSSEMGVIMAKAVLKQVP